jgi:hypothetical protein
VGFAKKGDTLEIIVRAQNPEYREFLGNEVKPMLLFILRKLSIACKFKLPPHLYLLPYRKPSKGGCGECHITCKTKVFHLKCAYARAGTGAKYDLYISVNIPACLRNGELRSSIAHEAAHIAEKIMTGHFTHGTFFERLNATAQKVQSGRKFKC